jgi:hypothetical protein
MNDPTHHVISALPGWSAAQTMRYNKHAALIWHPIIAWTIRQQMDHYVIAHSALPVIAGGSSSSQGSGPIGGRMGNSSAATFSSTPKAR